MKKIFLALAAVAALAACTKVEDTYENDVEITINPVAANRTKAMLSGTTFPDEQFNVWAYYKQVNPNTTIADWMSSSVEQQEYVVEKTFEKQTTTGLWGGVSSYYWPKVGSLMFVGYYPTSAADHVNYEFTSTVSKMTVYDYCVGDYATSGYVDNFTSSHTEDLMYFNMTPSSYNSTSVGASGNVNGNNVDVVFKHALSWINVVVVKDTNTPADAAITVNSIQFTDIKATGDAIVDNTVNNSTISWSAKGATFAVEVCPNDDPATTDFKENQVVLTTSDQLLAKQPIFIPQTMVGDLVVNYTITSTDGSKFTETKTTPLKGLNPALSSWLPAKKYTYTIIIGTSEILIDPVVADWEEVPVTAPIV